MWKKKQISEARDNVSEKKFKEDQTGKRCWNGLDH